MIDQIIEAESRRQKAAINLIAAENYTSDAVKSALASDFTNKYAEGYPGRRYYGGNENSDRLEREIYSLSCQLFNTDYHVNVQAYSGSIANLAVYFAVMDPGDSFLGLELSHGGHLTHGHPVTATGKLFKRHTYHVDPTTHLINYDELAELAKANKPKLIISGASAYSRQIDFERISKIAHESGALHLADISHIAGLVATGLHPTPFGNADFVTSTTHKILRGPRGALLFASPALGKLIDRSIFPGLQGGPHMNNIAAIGICLEEALKPEYADYCRQVIANAKTLADELSKLGLKIVTAGTDNHLFLVDLRPLGIGGQEAQDRLERVGIIVNKNAIPYDEASPQDPSGIRIGTPAITTRGMGPSDMPTLAKKIAAALK